MPIRSLSLLAIIVLLAPQLMVAAPADDTLAKDTQTLSTILQQDQADHAREDSDAALAAGKDLFPLQGGQASSNSAVVSPDSSLQVQVDGATLIFHDVTLQDWFAPYVRDMAERGIVNGYSDVAGKPTGQYGPGNNVTLAEVAKMAVRASGLQEAACTVKPRNPLATDWSAPFIACAEQNKWEVYLDSQLDLHRPATRGEVVDTILQAFGVRYTSGSARGTVFKDVQSQTQYAAPIEIAAADGIVSGYADHTFAPGSPVNRAEIAKMLSLAIQKYGKK